MSTPPTHLPTPDAHTGSPVASQIEPHFSDPGLPAHVHRMADTDPKAARRAERQVSLLFLLSAAGSVIFAVGYFAFPLPHHNNYRYSTLVLGTGLALATFCIGVAAIQWAKKLMSDEEVTEERHEIRSTDAERKDAARILRQGGEDAGFGRRKMIWGSMGAAMTALALPAVLSLKDLWLRNRGESPVDQLSSTPWAKGVRLVKDPTGEPILASSIPIGGVVHVLPEAPADTPLNAAGKRELTMEERSKSVVLLMRLEPGVVETLGTERDNWAYQGIYAYSIICTHVGCPVGLYEQQTHHLLCPCHQSTFDVTRHCAVIFGPAARPLPQLAINVDADGYLVATQGFQEPVGPSFWERG